MRIGIRSPLAAAAVLWLTSIGDSHGQGKQDVRLVVQLGHTNSVRAVTFSPDGKRILTGSTDLTARLWDAQTGTELYTLLGTGPVVGFSPDGNRIVTHGREPTVWDATTGQKVLSLKGHRGGIWSVAYSPDGKRIATGGYDKTIKVWDALTGQVIHSLEGHTSGVWNVSFSTDGKHLVSGGGADGIVKVWDAATGRETLSFKGHAGGVWSVAISPDGKRIVSGGEDLTVKVWDATTGQEVRALQGHTKAVRSVAFSPDGKRIVSGGYDKTVKVWDATTGQEALTFKRHTEAVLSIAFSPDSQRIVSGGDEMGARVWDAATGQEIFSLNGHRESVNCVAFSPAGKRLASGAKDSKFSNRPGEVKVWDTTTGQQVLSLKGHTGWVMSVAFSPDDKRIVSASGDGTVKVWDALTGRETFTLTGHASWVMSVAFSPDGKRIVSGGGDHVVSDKPGEVKVWDATTGLAALSLKGHTRSVTSVAFSPDGKRIVSGSHDQTVKVWDAQTGKELLTFRGHTNGVYSVAYSPDGKRVLSAGGYDHTARLWDAETGRELFVLQNRTLPGALMSSIVSSVAFSPDGKRFLTGSWDQTVRLWDTETGQERRVLQGHTSRVTSVAFTPDGKRILSGADDHTMRLWDAESGKELCRLVSFADGTWAVADLQGHYDASHGGDVEGLHWVVGLEPIALKQLKERYYDPGLLAKYLGLNPEPPRAVDTIASVKLFPEVAVVQADPKKPQLDLTLTNRGGGIGRVVVLINGKELTADARPPDADTKAGKLDLKVDLSADPRLIPGRKNTVEVLTYNADGYLSSRGLVREFDGPGTAVIEPPHLHAIVVGVSNYRGDKLNLRYAAKDAADFAAALHLAAGRLFGADKVHLTLLTMVEAEQRPSRANLVKALEALKATRSGDIVVVYLAGHGVTQGGQDGDWHYLTADAQSADLVDPVVRTQVSLSSVELTDLLKAAPAQKQVLILDTCHAGRVLEKLTDKRDVPGSQVRALERVKDRTGMHILAGCAADSVSYEASRYGQGILTYSLLLGMRGAKLREGEYVDIVDLFSFAADKVPELARDIGGVQRPTIASPKGSSFDIGRLTGDDRSKVPLQSVKPVVLRAVFQLEKVARDSLGLSKRINDRLREASAAARGAKLVYVDADEFPGAMLVGGRYKVEGDKVTVSVTLFEGEQEKAAFTLEGAASKPDELAGKIMAEVEKRLAASGGK